MQIYQLKFNMAPLESCAELDEIMLLCGLQLVFFLPWSALFIHNGT